MKEKKTGAVQLVLLILPFSWFQFYLFWFVGCCLRTFVYLVVRWVGFSFFASLRFVLWMSRHSRLTLHTKNAIAFKLRAFHLKRMFFCRLLFEFMSQTWNVRTNLRSLFFFIILFSSQSSALVCVKERTLSPHSKCVFLSTSFFFSLILFE